MTTNTMLYDLNGLRVALPIDPYAIEEEAFFTLDDYHSDCYAIKSIIECMFYSNQFVDLEKLETLNKVVTDIENNYDIEFLNWLDVNGYMDNCFNVIPSYENYIRWINDNIEIYNADMDILENGTLDQVAEFLDDHYKENVNSKELERLAFNPNLIIIDNGLSGKYYNETHFSLYENDPDNGRDYEYYISIDIDELIKEPQYSVYY